MKHETHMQLYFHESDKFPYQPISPIWMIIYTLPSFLFFFIINRHVVGVSSQNRVHSKANWPQRNTLISFIHSSLSSIFVVIAIIRAPEIIDDPFSHINRFNYAIAAFSFGYFLWDFIDCKKNSPLSVFGILVHHIAAIWFLGYVLFYTRILGYALYGLSLEINSVFLHARRLLRWYTPKSLSVKSKEMLCTFVMIGNYLTFFIFRFGVVGVCLHSLYYYGYRVSLKFYICVGLATFCVCILNLILLYRLINNDLKINSKLKGDKTNDKHIDQPVDEMLVAS